MSRVWDVPVHDSTRVRDVRVAAEAACAAAGLESPRAAAAALVATELATNLLKHAGGGRVVVNLVPDPDAVSQDPERHVQIASLDHGPGIADVAAALRDGYSTAPSSLGAGLGTCVRTADRFDLHSHRDRGTVAVARVGPTAPTTRARTRSAPPGPRVGGVNIPLPHAEHSGDAIGWVRAAGHLTLLLADGLGHGAKAAWASDAAVTALRRTAHLPLDEVLRQMHRALRPTRGAAVAVARLDTEAGELHFAGVGNVGARLHTRDDGWRSLISHPGIVGAHFPARVPLNRLPWTPDSLLILHSDGLPSRWTPPCDPELFAHDPAVVAAAVLRDAGSAARTVRDDTSVAVLAPDRGNEPR
ncbi:MULTISPECIES: SpoIIE family protein phosphatase [unclassified Streptomyces]|uniref:SpoIIE family protein phosphatase n=1 Tax=unclassified Streptomyces TaxID=2593676 RepID=UPI003D738D2E